MSINDPLGKIIAQLIIKRYPFLKKVVEKYPRVDPYEREELLIAAVDILKKIKYKTKVEPFGKIQTCDVEVVDEIVYGNIIVADTIFVDTTTYKCLCGGGSCAEFPKYVCSTSVKLIDCRYTCKVDYAYLFDRVVGLSSGEPFICGGGFWCWVKPKVSVNTAKNQVIISGTYYADYEADIKSIYLGGVEAGSTSPVNCCSSCPEEIEPGSTPIPVLYWKYETHIYENVYYTIYVIFQL